LAGQQSLEIAETHKEYLPHDSNRPGGVGY